MKEERRKTVVFTAQYSLKPESLYPNEQGGTHYI